MTAVCRRGAALEALPLWFEPEVVTSPEATLNTVWRRDDGLGASAVCFCWAPVPGAVAGGGGGGGTENRARSWASVSRISEVMSWLERRALVKILGGGKLRAKCGVSQRVRRFCIVSEEWEDG